MVPDRFVIHATVPRELYEDNPPALRSYIYECWITALLQAGGQPVDLYPEIRGAKKMRDGRILSPFEDQEDWDAVVVQAIGAVLRPEDEPAPARLREPAPEPDDDWEYSWNDAATWLPEMEYEE